MTKMCRRQRTSLRGKGRRRPLSGGRIVGLLMISAFWGMFCGAGANAGPPLSPASGSLVNHTYKVRPADTRLSGVVGQDIVLTFILDPQPLPQGVFLSVNMKQQTLPEGAERLPEILTGFPHTRMVFRDPGLYIYFAVVSLISKGSCGGVNADTLFKGKIDIQVVPVDSSASPAAF